MERVISLNYIFCNTKRRSMGQIIIINNETIKKSLEKSTRQYFAGNLSKPQEIEFVRDERLEIGISSYRSINMSRHMYMKLQQNINI